MDVDINELIEYFQGGIYDIKSTSRKWPHVSIVLNECELRIVIAALKAAEASRKYNELIAAISLGHKTTMAEKKTRMKYLQEKIMADVCYAKEVGDGR